MTAHCRLVADKGGLSFVDLKALLLHRQKLSGLACLAANWFASII